MKSSFVAVALIYALASACATLAESPVEGSATVSVTDADLIAARNTAYRLACVEAIRSASGDAARDTKNPAWLKMAENPQPYLANLKVLDEGIRSGEKYTVRLSGVVHIDQVQAAIAESKPESAVSASPVAAPTGTKIVDGPRPSVAVIITEKFQTIADAPPTLTPRLQEWLTGEGFVCLDLEQAQLASIRDQATAVLRGDGAAAKAVAAQLKAQWLLIGSVQVTTSPGLEGSDLKQRTASISCRLVESDSAGVIATAQTSGSCPEIDEMRGGQEAMRRGAEKLLPSLAQGINKFLSGKHPLAGRMVVRVLGVLSDPEQKINEPAELTRTLTQIPGVAPDSAAVVSLNSGLLEMEIRAASLTTTTLAAELTKRSVAGGRLILLDSQPRVLTLQFLTGTPGSGSAKTDRADAQAEALLATQAKLEYKPFDKAREQAKNTDVRNAMQQRVAAMAANDARRREAAALRKTLDESEAQLFAAEKSRKDAAERLAAQQKELESLRGQLARLTRELGEEKAAASELAQTVRSKEQSLAALVRDADQAQRDVGQRQAQLAGIRDRMRSYES